MSADKQTEPPALAAASRQNSTLANTPELWFALCGGDYTAWLETGSSTWHAERMHQNKPMESQSPKISALYISQIKSWIWPERMCLSELICVFYFCLTIILGKLVIKTLKEDVKTILWDVLWGNDHSSGAGGTEDFCLSPLVCGIGDFFHAEKQLLH